MGGRGEINLVTGSGKGGGRIIKITSTRMENPHLDCSTKLRFNVSHQEFMREELGYSRE